MVSSKARTATQYLRELPEERRKVVSAVRSTVRKHLPAGFQETMNWGMICYEVPLSRYPDTYNGQPLCVLALAAQARHYALYLTCIYQDPKQAAALKAAFTKAGKRLDMGKSCIRFRKLEDLPLPAIGSIIARNTPKQLIAQYEASRRASAG